MKSYEYPRVRPPTSLQPPQPPAESRFSWMDASGEQEDRVGTRTNTNTPAPQQASSQPNLPQAQAPMPSMEPHVYGGGVLSQHSQEFNVVQQQQPHAQAPQQSGGYYAHPNPNMQVPVQHPQPNYTQAAQQASRQPTQPYPTAQVPIHQQPYMPPPQHPIPPVPEPPEPVKKAAVPENQAVRPLVPIVPDDNPLTSTNIKRPNRASTNMAIVPPTSTDPGQFSASVFTPSPQSIKGGSWQHSFCSCAEPSICLTGLFCPCIVYGKTQYRLGLRNERKDPTNMLGYSAVNGSCIAFGVLCGFNGILAAIQRTRVRKTFNMSTEAGNVAGDCLKGVCCCCCVVAQDEKEVKFREEQSRKPAGSATKREGYVAPTSMSFSPPPR